MRALWTWPPPSVERVRPMSSFSWRRLWTPLSTWDSRGRQARELVIQTVLGSAVYAKEFELHLAELRNQVTSPGGTSAEAVYQLEKGGLRTVLSKAIWAAYNKSRLLGESMRRPVEGPLKIDTNGN